MPKRPLTPVDVHIGNQLYILRTMRGVSRAELGEHLGISYQQLQKYETGSNRLSASTLLKLAQFFSISTNHFFEMADTAPEAAASETNDRAIALQKFMSTQEGRELVSGYISIRNRKAQRQILKLIKQLSGENSED